MARTEHKRDRRRLAVLVDWLGNDYTDPILEAIVEGALAARCRFFGICFAIHFGRNPANG